jgi:hypothetical protein
MNEREEETKAVVDQFNTVIQQTQEVVRRLSSLQRQAKAGRPFGDEEIRQLSSAYDRCVIAIRNGQDAIYHWANKWIA